MASKHPRRSREKHFSGPRWWRAHAVPHEAYIWAAGLLAMATMDPTGAHLISLCPFDALRLPFCPGCGLGHAIAYLARGELAASWHAHPLGGPAVLILLHHITRLVQRS